MDKIERAVRAAVQGCDPHYCGQAADLLGIGHPDCFECGGDECDACAERVADAMAAHLMPDGVQWPRFEDGEPVRIGDEVLGKHGEPMAVTRVSFVEGGCYFNESHRKDGRKRGKGWRYVAGERVKRPETPDTQERIDADARNTTFDYWGCGDAKTCDECPALVDGETPRKRYGAPSCSAAKALDLLRRQRELCVKEAEARNEERGRYEE